MLRQKPSCEAGFSSSCRTWVALGLRLGQGLYALCRREYTPMLHLPPTIRAVICDVDGSWCSPLMWYGQEGETLKAFHVRDGHRMVAAQRAGLLVGLCSGRDSAPLRRRADDLGLSPVFLGVSDKVAVLQQWCAQAQITMQEICMVGDDEPDRPLISMVGCFVAPADADPRILRRAHLVSHYAAGQGVVAEVLESCLRQRGAWPPSDETQG